MYKIVLELDGDEILTIQKMFELSINDDWKYEYQKLLYKLHNAPKFMSVEIICDGAHMPEFDYLKGFHNDD